MWYHNMPGSSCRLCLSHTISGESPSLLGTISRPMSCSSSSLISTNQGMLFTQIKFSCSAWEIPYAGLDAFPKREAFVFLSSSTVSLCSQTAPCQQPFIKSSTQPKHTIPWAALSMDVFPVKQHRILYKDAQSKQQSTESWKTILTGTFPPTSPDWGQCTLPTWIISCWSHTPSPHVFIHLKARVTWISFFQGVFWTAFLA